MDSTTSSGPDKKSRILIGLLIVLLIFGLALWFTNILIPHIDGLVNTESFAQRNFFTKLFMLLLSLGVMWLSTKKLNLKYGFTRGINLNYFRFTKYAILLALTGLFSLIILNILGMVITGTKPSGFPSERLLDRILFIWIWSSIVEEILLRGWFQSFMGNLSTTVFRFRKRSISLTVFLSAIAFAALHLSLFLEGMSVFFIIGIFINTFLLGLLAAYLREKTESIFPSIYVHLIFNVVGSIPLLLVSLLSS